MKRNKIFSHNPDLALSDKYSEMVIPCLEIEFFNEKVDVLFDFIS